MTGRFFTYIFNLPGNWEEFSEGNRKIFIGPNNEELILSGAQITGSGVIKEFNNIKNEILHNAIETLKDAASNTDLEVIKDLEKQVNNSDFLIWKLYSRTKDQKILFLQSVIETEFEVILATCEMRNSNNSLQFFSSFLESFTTMK